MRYSPNPILITLQLNPTLSAALSYSSISNTGAEFANGNGNITVTSPGTILYTGYATTNSILPSNILDDDFLSYLGMTIGNVASYGTIGYKEY